MKVDLHQGSSLSPYLFDFIIDVLVHGVKQEAPWCMFFADDIFLCSKTRMFLSRKLEKGIRR